MNTMTYDEACEYMSGLGARGIKPGLETIESLLNALGNPQDNLKFIHVAGTNGKGSVSNFIYEILREEGYKVGVYSSPAVFNPLEIIKVNGRNISKADYAELVDIISKCNDMCATRFEVETALAFMFFNNEMCDYVVLETGMGGLLDATNIVKTTIVSVLTAIGMDHMQYLGNDLHSIALNKAGIIKEKSHVVYINDEEEVEAAIIKTCENKSASFIKVDTGSIRKVKHNITGSSFSYKGNEYTISLKGTYQIYNACIAIDVANCLNSHGHEVNVKSIYKGLKKANIKGRFEIISAKPYIVLDGAHNIPAAIALKESLNTYFTKKKYIYIMGMFRDKDTEEVINLMAPMAEHIITVTLPNRERSLTAYELADKVCRVNPMVTSADSIYEACELASLMAGSGKNMCIVAFGSLSHLSIVREYYSLRKPGGKETKV